MHSIENEFENETTVNLKSASFVASLIMLLHKGLTHILYIHMNGLSCILAT